MSGILSLINSLSGECSCGVFHETAVRDIVIESGAVHKVGAVLRRNGFPKKLLLVADKNTIKEDELKSLLSTITEVMSKYGTKKDLPLMKPFTNLGIYTDIDFRDIIKDLQG